MLNKTNNCAPSAAPSATTVSGWAGKIVVVFPTMVEFRGKMVPGSAGAYPAAEAGDCRERPGPAMPTPKPAAVDAASERSSSMRGEPSRRRSRLEKPSLADDLDDEIPF